MKSESNQKASDLFLEWQSEDQEMKASINQLCSWMNEVNQLGIPHFGEAGGHLQTLRRRLVQHFEHEDLIIANLAESFEGSANIVDELRERSTSEHQHIMQQLDDLIERLNSIDPPFTSWSEAMSEVDSLTAELERHEQDETDHMQAILVIGESSI